MRLLTDVQRVFDIAEKMHTERLLEALNALEDAPWGDLRGRELDARRLAKMLHPYDVRPADQRIGEKIAKGYDRGDFYDAWQRYLPCGTRATSATGATAVADVADVALIRPGEGGDVPWFAVDSTNGSHDRARDRSLEGLDP